MEDTGVSARENALIVMARYPEPGRVKTRLAASIGDAAAAALYRAFLDDLRARLAWHRSWVFHWAFEPVGSPFRAELAAETAAFAQVEGDLGARMHGAMTRGLRGGALRVVLIGSDVPHVPLSTLEEAFRRLSAGADLVVGPAEDGGYYMIGSRSVPPVFEDIRWGGSFGRPASQHFSTGMRSPEWSHQPAELSAASAVAWLIEPSPKEHTATASEVTR